MLILTVNKEFLNNYRQYKLDLIDGVLKEDICYKNLEHVLNNGKTLSYLMSESSECDKYDLNIMTGEITNKVNSTECNEVAMSKMAARRIKTLKGIK